jgi:thiamine kinase-like enzyme
MSDGAPWSAEVQQALGLLFDSAAHRTLALSIEPEHITGVRRLSVGMSNENFLLSTASLHLVLRVNSVSSSVICDRQAEVAAWRLAEAAGLAPRLQWVSADYRYYLSDYLEEVPSSQWQQLAVHNRLEPSVMVPSALAEVAKDAQVSESLAGAEDLLLTLLCGLRLLPVPENHMGVEAQWLEYKRRLLEMRQAIGAEGSATGLRHDWHQALARLLDCEGAIQAWLARLDACLIAHQYCHRDLSPYNLLLKEGRLWCIDFEYACASHPLFELAGVIASHALGRRQRDKLILAYLQDHPHLHANALAALPAAVGLYWCFAACWALIMAAGALNSPEPGTGSPHSPFGPLDYLLWFRDYDQLMQPFVEFDRPA